MKSSVLLLSGGVDSATALLELLDQRVQVHALSVHYGQRHLKELDYARKLAERYEVAHQIIDLSSLKPLIDQSSQTGDIEVPLGHYTAENMKQTIVPNRNMILLSLAAAWALNLKAESVCYAAHSGDHHIYPDCRPEFAEAMNHAFQLCDWQRVNLLRPFIHWTKAEIVKRADTLGLDFDLTWSCYQGKERHCGECGTCVERKEAFQIAKIEDPTIYEPASRPSEKRASI